MKLWLIPVSISVDKTCDVCSVLKRIVARFKRRATQRTIVNFVDLENVEQ